MEWFDRCVAADLMTGVIDVMADVMGVPRVMGRADMVWCD